MKRCVSESSATEVSRGYRVYLPYCIRHHYLQSAIEYRKIRPEDLDHCGGDEDEGNEGGSDDDSDATFNAKLVEAWRKVFQRKVSQPAKRRRQPAKRRRLILTDCEAGVCVRGIAQQLYYRMTGGAPTLSL